MTTPFWAKRTSKDEKLGPRKKSKARKSSLDLITLTKGDLNDIEHTVRDVTMELLQ